MGYSLGEGYMSNSQISSIRGALKRLISKKDILGNSYFYDEIAVMTAHDFKHYVKLNYMQDKSA